MGKWQAGKKQTKTTNKPMKMRASSRANVKKDLVRTVII